MGDLLEVKNLNVSFKTYAGKVSALNGVSFSVSDGEAIGIVGESGCGKSVTMLAIMKLLSENGRIDSGKIVFGGNEIQNFTQKQMQALRGKEIGMIFQDPMTSLNPVFKIGNQLTEAILRHNGISKEEAGKKAVETLKTVGIPDPEKRMDQYPFEYSGGMRQRILIAMALSCSPRLLIADEPTTALDVTIQAQIIELMKALKDRLGMSIILISHDFGVVAGICRRVMVMYGGIIVEQGKVDEIFYKPAHPYTIGLLKSIPGANPGKGRLKPIDGQPPDMLKSPEGCPFVQRCPRAMVICTIRMPGYRELEPGHGTACWLHYNNLIQKEIFRL